MKRATARIKSASALKVETGKPWATSGKRLQSGVRQGRAVLDGQGLEEGTMQGNLVDHCGSIISCSYAQYRKLAASGKGFHSRKSLQNPPGNKIDDCRSVSKGIP